jgi:hypothetical protein
MKNSILIKGALITAALPLFAGCVVYRQAPPPSTAVVETEAPAPPPPQVEVAPVAPGPLTVWFWVPGCWEWRGHWVWAGGRWAARPYAGAAWVGAHWGYRGHHRVWIEGRWR